MRQAGQRLEVWRACVVGQTQGVETALADLALLATIANLPGRDQLVTKIRARRRRARDRSLSWIRVQVKT